MMVKVGGITQKADGLIHDWVEGVAMSPDGVLSVTSCYEITQFDGKRLEDL